MIDEREIMPYNFFCYGGVYSGDHNGMRYVIRRQGDKPDFILTATVWRGPYCYDAVEQTEKTVQEFEYSEEGRLAAIDWLKVQYEERKAFWDEAPSILDAPIELKYGEDKEKQ